MILLIFSLTYQCSRLHQNMHTSNVQKNITWNLLYSRNKICYLLLTDCSRICCYVLFWDDMEAWWLRLMRSNESRGESITWRLNLSVENLSKTKGFVKTSTIWSLLIQDLTRNVFVATWSLIKWKCMPMCLMWEWYTGLEIR